MSDMGIHAYIMESNDDSIDRAKNLLAGIDSGAQKAIGSAIKRTATAAQTLAAKEIHAEYSIKSSDFKKHTRAERKIIHENGTTTLAIMFHGVHIPLIEFDTKIGKDGRVYTRVKRTSAKEALNHAFRANIGGRIGIFERETEARIPTHELQGPSTAQMMSYNEDLQKRIGEKVVETFESRLEHETTAILNGWRK